MSISSIEAQRLNPPSSSSSPTVNPNLNMGMGMDMDMRVLSLRLNFTHFISPIRIMTRPITLVRKRRGQVTSGNHLLNFHFDPIQRPNQPGRGRPSPFPRQHRKLRPYNKGLFLQANYKFVVLDSANHGPESLDPDKMLQWDQIICLRYSSPSAVICPFCLEPPLCAQITSCGHIFCFPCILRYLLMGEEDKKGEPWKKCPLCFVMISPKDLYTVFIESVGQYGVGDRLEFSLLTRQKDSSSALRRNEDRSAAAAESYDPFSKVTFTSDVELSVRKAMADLDGWIAKADMGLVDDLERLPYVCAAMEHLKQRKKY